ncbi:MAG: hypothetical protein QOI10_486 [Solirubrobacterales bacterium]|jgi:hypothetical protein|nr:hypothetical protein [Solirubrobacterales bacterium]
MPGHRTRSLVLAALLGALCVLTAGTGSAGATAARTLGKTTHTPPPSCPKTPCEAVGSVTGFQVIADGTRAPFKARTDAWIVGWALGLSDPNKSQHDFFADFYQSNQFGMIPTARISVLKRKDERNYKLKAQSPVVGLGSVLGTRQTFTLTDPIKIRKGEFLALTIPTWAPSFAVNLTGPTNVWRSSRVDGQCSGTDNIKNGKPQQRVGSERSFGCDYKTARLLYWGYYVPR